MTVRPMGPRTQRLLMTTDAVGGVWTYAMDLCAALGALGVEVVLATMGPRPTPQQRMEAVALGNVTLEESELALEWMADPWREVEQAGQWLLELEETWRPDLVHLNGYVHATLPFSRPVLVVGHSDVTSWWLSVKGTWPPDEWQEYRRRVALGLRAADRVVTPTAWMLRELCRLYGVAPRGRVIPNGCMPCRPLDGRGPGPEGPDPAPRGLAGAAGAGAPRPRVAPPEDEPGAPPLIFSAGRIWDAAKNVEALATCAAELGRPIYVAGDETPPPGQPSGLPGGLEGLCLLGRLASAEMDLWLRRASIYVLPARYEPFGLSVLEAAVRGCALVLGDIGSLREVWGDAALYVPPGRADVLVDVLAYLSERPAATRGLADRARTRAEEMTAERMARAYQRLYQEMTAERAGGRACAS